MKTRRLIEPRAAAEVIPVLSDLIESELLGLSVAHAARSIGSMFLLDFGNLEVNPGWRKPSGDWSLLAQFSAWRIHAPGVEATNDDAHDVMDLAISSLQGKKIKSIRLSPCGSMEMLVDGDLSLLLTIGSQDEYDGEDYNDMWTIYRRLKWNLTFNRTGSFEIE